MTDLPDDDEDSEDCRIVFRVWGFVHSLDLSGGRDYNLMDGIHMDTP